MALAHADLLHVDDQGLVEKIMAKREAEAERRARFFNVKTRTIGLDVPGLNAQLADKRRMQQQEAEADNEYQQTALMIDQIAMVCEHEKTQADRARQQAARDFSKTHLRKEQRREFALSDPDHLKKDRPARDGDDDPRCGPASVQKFEGEKIEYDKTTNRKVYQNQQKQWLVQQMEEKAAMDAAQKEEDRRYDEQVIMANHIRGVMEQHLEDTKRGQKKEESAFNRALASEHQERHRNFLRRQNEEDAKHVDNVMTNPMLQDGPAAPVGLDGRAIRANFKGYTQDQKHEIYEYNSWQMQQKRNARNAEKAEEAMHAADTAHSTAVLGAVDQHRQALAVHRRKMMDDENTVIAQAQRNMQQHLGKTYANEVGDDYFAKFNCTAR